MVSRSRFSLGRARVLTKRLLDTAAFPRLDALLSEGEIRELAAHALQRFPDRALPAALAEEQEIAAPAGAQELAAQGAAAARLAVHIVDAAVGDVGVHLELAGPGAIQHRREVAQAAFEQRVLHVVGQLAGGAQPPP